MIRTPFLVLRFIFFACGPTIFVCAQADLHRTEQDALETHGLSVLLFHNSYHRVFGDQKMSGLEIILQDQRIATNGDVRLSATPAQWDPIPELGTRHRGPSPEEFFAECSYADQHFTYRIDVRPEPGGFRIAVQLDHPIPDAIVGKAGFNLEFLPSLYFGKSFLAGDVAGVFPRHSGGPMERTADSKIEPLPLAQGGSLVLSPEDRATRVAIRSESGPIFLFDGRNQAQNGWFVARTLIPAGKSGDVVVWHVHPNMVEGWVRPPVVGYNQVGYTPERNKTAVIELDPLCHAPKAARVVEIAADGEWREVFSGVRGGHAVETDRLWQQPSRLHVHTWGNDSGRGDYSAGFSRTEGRLAVLVV